MKNIIRKLHCPKIHYGFCFYLLDAISEMAPFFGKSSLQNPNFHKIPIKLPDCLKYLRIPQIFAPAAIFYVFVYFPRNRKQFTRGKMAEVMLLYTYFVEKIAPFSLVCITLITGYTGTRGSHLKKKLMPEVFA